MESEQTKKDVGGYRFATTTPHGQSCEDDSKDECVDNESEGIGSDSSEEGTQVSERELEDEEQGEATLVPCDATIAPFV